MTASVYKAFTEGFPTDVLADSSTFGQSIIDEFSILGTLLPYLHHELIVQLQELLPYVSEALQCKYSVVRFTAARCFACLCKADLISGMKFMVETIIPMFADQQDVKRRQGAIECIYRISASLQLSNAFRFGVCLRYRDPPICCISHCACYGQNE
jgi:TATA-binding protein-associated factor